MTDGLYYPDGSFKSRAKIVAENYEDGVVIQKTELPHGMGFEDWVGELQRRQEARQEFSIPSEIDIEIPSKTPIAIALMGDQHIGGMYHDIELMASHTQLIEEHPLFYVMLGGDIVNGMYWNPGQNQEITNYEEQVLMARLMMDKLKGKILCAWQGDHDMWAEKNGLTMYYDFQERYGSHMLRGSSVVRVTVGGELYTIVGAHRLPGFSMYNNNHPQMREANFGQQGADIYVSWHTHQKGIHQQVAKQAGREDLLQTFVSSGAYKYSDEYAQKLGYAHQTEKELGATFLVLYPDDKRVSVHWNAQGAIDEVAPFLR